MLTRKISHGLLSGKHGIQFSSFPSPPHLHAGHHTLSLCDVGESGLHFVVQRHYLVVPPVSEEDEPLYELLVRSVGQRAPLPPTAPLSPVLLPDREMHVR